MDTNLSITRIAEARSKQSLLFKSAEGATLLILLQVASRALTFTVNQILLRYLSPELLGISTQLEVYSISVLLFAREALRVAIQRQTDSTDDGSYNKTSIQSGAQGKARAANKTQAVVNLAYISLCSGTFLAFGLGWVYWSSLQSTPSILNTPYFHKSLLLYGAASVLELIAEPAFVVVQQKSLYKIRASAESTATILRCLVTCICSILASRRGTDFGVLPFALGQGTYGLALSLIYYWNVRPIAYNSGFSLTPRPIWSNNGDIVLSHFSRSLLRLGASLCIQGVVKHLLTQGDVILVSYLATLQAQGIYALASNYGGLVARIVLQPIEESCRNYFGKSLSSIEGPPSEKNVKSASKDLHNLLRFYLILSVLVASVGPTIAPLLLDIVAGPRWISSGAGDVLAKYCYYIPVLAVNGVTEAFISAVATETELNEQSMWMLGFSVGFAAAGYVFLGVLDFGAEGLVWANVINMTVRITWSGTFINSYLIRNGSNLNIFAMLPQSTTIALGVCTAVVLSKVKLSFTGGLVDLIKSGLIAAAFLILL